MRDTRRDLCLRGSEIHNGISCSQYATVLLSQAVLEGVIPERSLSKASDLYHVHANGPGSLGKAVDSASYLCFRDTPRSKVAEGFAQVMETVRWDGLREAMLRTAGGGPEVFLDNRKSLTRWGREGWMEDRAEGLWVKGRWGLCLVQTIFEDFKLL